MLSGAEQLAAAFLKSARSHVVIVAHCEVTAAAQQGLQGTEQLRCGCDLSRLMPDSLWGEVLQYRLAHRHHLHLTP